MVLQAYRLVNTDQLDFITCPPARLCPLMYQFEHRIPLGWASDGPSAKSHGCWQIQSETFDVKTPPECAPFQCPGRPPAP